jgi:integrase
VGPVSRSFVRALRRSDFHAVEMGRILRQPRAPDRRAKKEAQITSVKMAALSFWVSTPANFHSFRRWFITEAERAGQPENIIAAVVGHKRQGMTLGVYSRGSSGEQFRTCVEAVQFPKARATEPQRHRTRTAKAG